MNVNVDVNDHVHVNGGGPVHVHVNDHVGVHDHGPVIVDVIGP